MPLLATLGDASMYLQRSLGVLELLDDIQLFGCQVW